MICATYMYNISYKPILSLPSYKDVLVSQLVSLFTSEFRQQELNLWPSVTWLSLSDRKPGQNFAVGAFFLYSEQERILHAHYIHVLTVHDEKLGFYYYVNLFRELGGGKGRCKFCHSLGSSHVPL